MVSFHLTIIRIGGDGLTAHQSLLHSRVFLVPHGNSCFSLLPTHPSDTFYQGRSEWSTILNDAFGSAFQSLLRPEILPLFAQVLFSGLRVKNRDFG